MPKISFTSENSYNSNTLLPSVKNTSHHFDLIQELVLSEFKLRYQNSLLGYFWTLIKPLLLFSVIFIVFTLFMPSPIEKYPVYLLLGILIWNFFSEATLIGMNTFHTKRELITKVYFPRASLVFASTISSFITLLLNLVIFFLFLFISQTGISIESLFFIIYLIELYLIVTGVTFILASLYMSFHDLQHIWEVLLQIGFWLTPIIYSVTVVPFQYHQLIFLNPLARIIEYSRDLFMNHHIPAFNLNLVLFIMSVVIFTAGYFVFKTQEDKVAEKL